MTDLIRNNIQRSLDIKQAVLQNDHLIEMIQTMADVIGKAFADGYRVFFCGNGGSAADAQHMAAEFSGPYYDRNRRALPSEALHCNTSYLTAAANDFEFKHVYARLVSGIMNPGDVLVGLSTSGNSANVVAAFEAAREKGVTTIGMTGDSGGKMKALSDYLFNVPSSDTPRIQEMHMLAGHTICELVEKQLFPAS